MRPHGLRRRKNRSRCSQPPTAALRSRSLRPRGGPLRLPAVLLRRVCAWAKPRGPAWGPPRRSPRPCGRQAAPFSALAAPIPPQLYGLRPYPSGSARLSRGRVGPSAPRLFPAPFCALRAPTCAAAAAPCCAGSLRRGAPVAASRARSGVCALGPFRPSPGPAPRPLPPGSLAPPVCALSRSVVGAAPAALWARLRFAAGVLRCAPVALAALGLSPGASRVAPGPPLGRPQSRPPFVRPLRLRGRLPPAPGP